MPETPDQHLIDELARKWEGKTTPNGKNGHHKHAASILDDDQLVDLCRKAKNAARFATLFDDGDTASYSSSSEADAALLSIMAFYCQDPNQLDRVFRRSALMRRKWERRDYRERTINFVLENLAETYQCPDEASSPLGGTATLHTGVHTGVKGTSEANSHSHSLGSTGTGNEENSNLKRSIEAISFSGREKPGPREWIVDNHIWKGYPANWYGDGGVAKSLLALHLGVSVAASECDYWNGFAIKNVPVIYLDFELDADEQHRRVLQICEGMGREDSPEELYYISAIGVPPVEAFGAAAEECKRLGAEFVIVDSVGFALEGDSELARDVLAFYRNCLGQLIQAKASPLTIDHQAKLVKGEKYLDKQAFGSVYKTNATRSVFQIRGAWDENIVTATFTHKKNNFGRKEKDFSLEVCFEGDAIKIERLAEAIPNPDKEPTKKEQVLEAFETLRRATAKEVSAASGIELKTVQNAVGTLVSEGLLEDTGEKLEGARILIPGSQPTKGMGMGMEQESKPTLDISPKQKFCEHNASVGKPCMFCPGGWAVEEETHA